MTAKEKVIERCRRDLLFFGKAVSPNMFTVRSADFHREIADHLLNPSIRLLNIIAPRGHAKSSIVACLMVLHHLVFHEGNVFVVLVSKTEGHAEKLLQTVKDVLEYSLHFRALFGYWGRHFARSWQTKSVELTDPRNTKRKLYILVRGANQQMRGLKYINQRPTLVVFDDPEDEANTKSEEARANNFMGLMKGIVPGLDAKVGRCVVIGTPIHAQGLVNTLEEMNGWVTLKYRALNERTDLSHAELSQLPEEQRYTALWPEVWPVKKLLDLKRDLEAIGRASAFYSEYQCEIVGDKDQLFPPSTFRFWEGNLHIDANREAYLEITHIGKELVELETPRKVPVNVFMGVDPASSTSRTADFSVIFVIAMDADKNIYCLDYFRKRVKPMTLADQIVRMYEKYRPKKTQIETVGYQEMLRDYLKTHIDQHIPGLEIPNKPRNSKTERLESLQPEFAMGKVFLRISMNEFMDELALFPFGKHDDTLDAFYYARKGAYRPYHDVEESGKVTYNYQPLPGTLDWMVV